MDGDHDKLWGQHFDTEDSLLLRARLVRKASISWLPPRRDWPVLHSALIKPPKHVGDSWLVVFKATTEDGEKVAFHKGKTLMAALANGLTLVFTNRITWKVETPYRPDRSR